MVVLSDELFWRAARLGRKEEVERGVTLGYGLGTVYKDKSALMAATINGHLGTVRILLSQAPDPENINMFCSGRTALHCAAREGHTAIVLMLLDAGADPSAVTTSRYGHGFTALNWAEYYHKPTAAAILEWARDVGHEPY